MPNIYHTHTRTHARTYSHTYTHACMHARTHTIESQQGSQSQPTSSSSNPASILSHSRLLQRSVCQRISRSTLLPNPNLKHFYFIFVLFLRGMCVTWNLLKSSKLQLDCVTDFKKEQSLKQRSLLIPQQTSAPTET